METFIISTKKHICKQHFKKIAFIKIIRKWYNCSLYTAKLIADNIDTHFTKCHLDFLSARELSNELQEVGFTVDIQKENEALIYYKTGE